MNSGARSGEALRSFLHYIPHALGVIALIMYGWLFWSALISVVDAMHLRAYPKPYTAHIVGFEKHIGAKTDTYAPIVEVDFPSRPSFRFTARKFGSKLFMSVGDAVTLVHRDGTDILGRPIEVIEIDDAFHLWAEDVLLALLMPLAILIAVVWPYLRFRNR